MHGRWAVVGLPFAGGRLPGSVHAHCRCHDILLARKPAVMLPIAAVTGYQAAA